jgi:hypothetical protein
MKEERTKWRCASICLRFILNGDQGCAFIVAVATTKVAKQNAGVGDD